MARRKPDPSFSQGAFVEVVHNNEWTLGYVVSIKREPHVLYNVQLMTDGEIVAIHPDSIRASNIDMGSEEDDIAFAPVPDPDQAQVPVTTTRFATSGEDRLRELELAAKSANTHKQTVWGIKAFKG